MCVDRRAARALALMHERVREPGRPSRLCSQELCLRLSLEPALGLAADSEDSPGLSLAGC